MKKKFFLLIGGFLLFCFINSLAYAGGLEFDGEDGYVKVKAIPTMTSWTLSARVKPDTVDYNITGQGMTILTNDRGGWNDDVLFGLVPETTAFSTNKRFAVIHQDRETQVRTVVEDIDDAVAGEWYHVVAVSNGSELILYVNGIEKAREERERDDLNFDGAELFIGANSWGRNWDGIISNICIYKRVLTPEEIYSNYTGEIIQDESLIMYHDYTLGHAYDLTGYNGTLVGGPVFVKCIGSSINIYYRDADNDKFGDPYNSVSAFIAPFGFVENNLDCNDEDITIYTGAPELCDAKDNDCDGLIDEDLIRPCLSLCGNGREICQDGKWIECDAPQPEPEVCDGLDNDCDGLKDETFNVGKTCSVGVGACKRIGFMVCTSDGLGTECNAKPDIPKDEVCDEIDNNCNGEIDEDGARGCLRYYMDADSDGCGVADDSRCLCKPDITYDYTAVQSGDPDDGNPLIGCPYQCLFMMTITAIGQDLEGAVNESKVFIGRATNAISSLAPPPLPKFTVDVKLKDISTSEYYKQDIRQFGHDWELWLIEVMVSDNYAIQSDPDCYPELIWDPDVLCSEGYFSLWSSDASGALVSLLVEDMRAVSSYQVTQGNIAWFAITCSENPIPENIVFSLHLPQGWNMISLPVLPSSMVLGDLFPEVQVVYGYDRMYYRVNYSAELELGRGYWIYMPIANTYHIIGTPIISHNVDVNEGWSMIGSCSYPAHTSVNRGRINAIYGFGNGYQLIEPSGSLDPGQGFWVSLIEPAMITVSSGDLSI